MIGPLTDKYETGLELKEILEKKEIIEHSENISHVFGFHQKVFLFSNEEIKEKHNEKMKEKGWKVVDAQDFMNLYFSFWDKEDRAISVPCAVYETKIKGSFAD